MGSSIGTIFSRVLRLYRIRSPRQDSQMLSSRWSGIASSQSAHSRLSLKVCSINKNGAELVLPRSVSEDHQPRKQTFYGSAAISKSPDAVPPAPVLLMMNEKLVAPPKINVPVAPPPAVEVSQINWNITST